MQTLGAVLGAVESGSVEIILPFSATISPAAGERFVAVGKVIKPGRTLTVCSGEVHAVQGESRKLICLMQATMMAVRPSA